VTVGITRGSNPVPPLERRRERRGLERERGIGGICIGPAGRYGSYTTGRVLAGRYEGWSYTAGRGAGRYKGWSYIDGRGPAGRYEGGSYTPGRGLSEVTLSVKIFALW